MAKWWNRLKKGAANTVNNAVKGIKNAAISVSKAKQPKLVKESTMDRKIKDLTNSFNLRLQKTQADAAAAAAAATDSHNCWPNGKGPQCRPASDTRASQRACSEAGRDSRSELGSHCSLVPTSMNYLRQGIQTTQNR